MKSGNFEIDKMRVAAPCPMSWEAMTGDERVRRCHACELNIYNIAEMTADEARRLIENREGRLCIRLQRRADGTVLTAEEPLIDMTSTSVKTTINREQMRVPPR